MNRVVKLAAAAALVFGGVAVTAGAASAAIVCNGANECWHAKRHYHYRPEFGLTVHPDNWAWGPNDHYKWREHRGRGYWRNGVWITF